MKENLLSTIGLILAFIAGITFATDAHIWSAGLFFTAVIFNVSALISLESFMVNLYYPLLNEEREKVKKLEETVKQLQNK